MAEERSVVVRMRAEFGSYLGGLRTAAVETRALASTTSTFTRQQEIGLTKVGFAAGAMGAAVAGGLALAVSRFADFDKALSGVRAVSDATAGQMGKLRAAAIDAGQATVFSASDAAKAEAELTKAGVAVRDVLGGGLRGSLDLAAAGQLELADSATIAAQAMNIFDLQGRDVGHIADVLAAGANKSAADVKQLGDALRQGGLVSSQFNIGLESTVGTLAAFADNALVGSDAGTSYKTMLQRLVPQSDEAQKAMDRIGFSAFDVQGNFVGLEGVAGQLRAGLKDLTEEQRATALTTIFGSDAVRAANVLYEEGARGIADYTRAVNDQGAAQRMAAIQMDNLAGDLEQLKGSIETALIQTGSGANDSLRALTQAGTDAVNTFSQLPAPVQGGFTAMAALTGGTLLAVGAIGTLAPKVRETRKALEEMGSAGAFASKSLGAIGKAGAVGIVLVGISEAVHLLANEITKLEGKAAPEVDELTSSLVKFADSGKLSGASMRAVGRDASQLIDDLGAISGLDAKLNQNASRTSFGLFGRDFDQATDRVEALDKALATLVSQGYRDKAADIFLRIVQTGKLSADQVETLRGELDGYAKALDTAATSSTLTAGATDQFGNSVASTTGSIDDASDAAKEWAKDLAELAGAFIEPMDAYTSLLADKQAAEEASAQSTADATKSSKDSWEDYSHDVSVSIDEYMDKLQEQVRAQRDWKTNMLILSGRGLSEETLAALEKLGPEAAPLIAQFVDASDRQLRRLERLLRHDTADATQAIAEELIAAGPVLERVAAQSGDKVAEKFARRLAAGKTTVEQIARDYGWALVENIPAEVTSHVQIVGVDRAKSDAREIFEYFAALPRKITVRLGVGPLAGKEVPLADGGMVPTSLGGPREDNLFGFTRGGDRVAFSGGEFIVNARATAQNRALLDAINGGQRFRDGGWVSAARIPGSSTTRQLVSETRTHQAPVYVDHMEVADYDDFRRQEARQRDLQSSPGSMFGGR